MRYKAQAKEKPPAGGLSLPLDRVRRYPTVFLGSSCCTIERRFPAGAASICAIRPVPQRLDPVTKSWFLVTSPLLVQHLEIRTGASSPLSVQRWSKPPHEPSELNDTNLTYISSTRYRPAGNNAGQCALMTTPDHIPAFNLERIIMKTIAIALLATTVIGTSAFAASSDMQRQQQPTPQQTQKQSSGNAQTQNGSQRIARSQQGASPQDTRSATNDRPISTQNLSRREVRQVQQALDNDGFHAGPADGRWGPETRSAIKQFQQSKNIRADGRLNRQTVADLGLNASEFSPRSTATGM